VPTETIGIDHGMLSRKVVPLITSDILLNTLSELSCKLQCFSSWRLC